MAGCCENELWPEDLLRYLALAHNGQSLLALASEIQQQLEDVDEVTSVCSHSAQSDELFSRVRILIHRRRRRVRYEPGIGEIRLVMLPAFAIAKRAAFDKHGSSASPRSTASPAAVSHSMVRPKRG